VIYVINVVSQVEDLYRADRTVSLKNKGFMDTMYFVRFIPMFQLSAASYLDGVNAFTLTALHSTPSPEHWCLSTVVHGLSPR
jgi:hypothetical protein